MQQHFCWKLFESNVNKTMDSRVSLQCLNGHRTFSHDPPIGRWRTRRSAAQDAEVQALQRLGMDLKGGDTKKIN